MSVFVEFYVNAIAIIIIRQDQFFICELLTFQVFCCTKQYATLSYLQRWENRPAVTLSDFDKKLSETDAYLQILIDQVQVCRLLVLLFCGMQTSFVIYKSQLGGGTGRSGGRLIVIGSLPVWNRCSQISKAVILSRWFNIRWINSLSFRQSVFKVVTLPGFTVVVCKLCCELYSQNTFHHSFSHWRWR